MKQLPLINTKQMTSTREMRRHKRQALKEDRLPPAVRVMVNGKPTFENIEFNYPDETRNYRLSGIGPCPLCGMKMDKYMCVDFPAPEYKKKFRIVCTFQIGDVPGCDFKTAWQNSSKEAMAVWKVMTAIHR